MPKDKSSSSFSNKSHDLFYKPYPSRDRSSSKQEDAALEEVTCPICMESPHNAVLLLCSSSDKGCRPFMCDTSYRHSNCLDQYIKAHAKSQQASNGNAGANDNYNMTINNVSSNSSRNDLINSAAARGGSADISDHVDIKTCKGLELVCPLCRGKVVGWKVVDKVRQYHNYKRRGCAQDSCTYVGAYEQLRKHARYIHPFARPSEVDPARQRDWWRLESQRDLGDVFSSIQSAMPGATIVGDYVIEEGDEEDDRDEEAEPENEFEMEHDEEEEEDEYHDEIAMTNNTSSSNSSRSSVPPVDNRLWTMLFLFRVLGGTSAPSDASAVSAAAASSHHSLSHSHSHSRHHLSPQQRNHQQQSSQQQHRRYVAPPPPRNNRGAPRSSPGSFHQGSSSSSSSRAAMIERSRTSSSSSSATSFRRSRRSLR